MNNEAPIYNYNDPEDNGDDALYTLEDDERLESVVAEEGDEAGLYVEEYDPESDMPYAYGKSGDEDDEVEDVKEAAPTDKTPLSLLLRVMFSPATGWRTLKRSRIKPERFGMGIFYPLCALASAAQFCSMIYEANQTISSLVVSAMIVFISIFFSYFTIPILAGPFLTEQVKKSLESNFGKVAIMTALSTLAAFDILFELLPPLEPVLVFLPIWTMYLLTRLTKFLGTPKEKLAMTATILCILVIGLPFVWKALLEFLLKR